MNVYIDWRVDLWIVCMAIWLRVKTSKRFPGFSLKRFYAHMPKLQINRRGDRINKKGMLPA